MSWLLRQGAAPLFVVALLLATGCSADRDESAPGPVHEPEVPGPMAPAPHAPVAPQEDPSFARLQEERTLAQQRSQLLVEQYLATARRMMEASNFEGAEQAALQALEVNPTSRDAIEALRQARLLQGHPLDTMEELTQFVLNKRQLMRQQQQALVQDHYTRANQAFAAGDLGEARKLLEQADLVVRFDPWQTPFGPTADDVRAMLRDVNIRLAEKARRDETQAFDEAYKRLREDEERRRVREAREVHSMMEEAIAAFGRQDFETSGMIAERVLRRVPGHPEAKSLVESSRRAKDAAWRERYYRERREGFQTWLERTREAQIPYTSILGWSRDWDELTLRRAQGDPVSQAAQESDAVRVLRAKLANETFEVDYGAEGKALPDIVKDIRSQKSMNILIDPEIDSAKLEEPVRLTLSRQSLGTALKTILDQLDLAMTFRNDVLHITTREKALGKPIPQVYEVRDLTVSLPNFKAPNLNLRVGQAGEQAKVAIAGENLESTQETTIDRLVDLIQENVAKGTWGTIEGFALTPSSGQIVATTTPEIHQQLKKFLDELRRFTKISVHVEARFLSLTRGFLSDIGVDFRGTGGANPGTVALLDDVSNGAPYNASAGFDNGGPGGAAAASLSPSSGAFYSAGNNGDIRARTENIFNRALGTVLTNIGGATVQFSILDDLQISTIFRAVEKNIDNTLLNAPRLTIFNNQRANLTLVNQVSYVKDYDVEVAQTAFIADPIVDVVQDGLTLDVKPVVSHDRKYVTLEVNPTLATLTRPIRTFESNLSGLTTPVVIELPEVRYSQASTTVRVPDGGYLVIGGLKTVQTIDRRSEVPVLSDIPLISFLFSRKGRSDELRDLLIVLHVRIVDLSEEEARLAR
jgi:Flp pilus assembly secretin CpaC